MSPSKEPEPRREGRERRRDKAVRIDDGFNNDQKHRQSPTSQKAPESNVYHNHIYINHGTKKERTVTSSSSLSTSPVNAHRQKSRYNEGKSYTRHQSKSPQSGADSDSESGSDSDLEWQHDHPGKKSRRSPLQKPAKVSKRSTVPWKRSRKDQAYEKDHSHDEEQEASEIEEGRRPESESDDRNTDREDSDSELLEDVTSGQQEQSDGFGNYESDDDFGHLKVEVKGNRNKIFPVEAILDTGTDSNWVSDEFREQLGLRRQHLDDKERKLKWNGFTGKEFGASGKIELDILCDEFSGHPHRRETCFVATNAGFQILIGRKVIVREGIYRRNRHKPQGDSAYAGIHSKKGKAEQKDIERRKIESDLEAEKIKEKKKAARKKTEESRAQNQNEQPRAEPALFARSKPKAVNKPRPRQEKDIKKTEKSSRSRTTVEEPPAKSSRSRKGADEYSKPIHRSGTNELPSRQPILKADESYKSRDRKEEQDTNWSSDESVNAVCF